VDFSVSSNGTITGTDAQSDGDFQFDVGVHDSANPPDYASVALLLTVVSRSPSHRQACQVEAQELRTALRLAAADPTYSLSATELCLPGFR
jgi:hypothetical protein